MKRNGTTSKGTTRWRCKQCGASSVKRRNDITNAAVFTQFIEHCTTAISLDDLAKRNGVSRATMKRRFKWCWLVDVPDPTAGHHKRIYDQVFLDGTYTAGGCLIVAATIDHVIAWHWCKHETTRDYQLLLERIEAPLIAVIDGGQGAYSAIKKCWPTTKIQRCLVHAQRVVRRYTTTNPRTDAGRTICQNCNTSMFPPTPGWLPPPPPANAVDATTPPAPSVAIAATAATPAFIIFLPKFM